MLDLIKKILADEFISEDQTILIESNTNSQGNSFYMQRIIIPGNLRYLLYRFDPNRKDLFPFFKKKDDGGAKSFRTICDYVAFVEDDCKLFPILIEMKYGKDSPKVQLESTECFVRYVLEMARIIYPNIIVCDKIIKVGISNRDFNIKPGAGIKHKGHFSSSGVGYFKHFHNTHFRLKDVISLDS